MATRPGGTAAPKLEIILGEPEPDTLRAIGGSRSDRFNNMLIKAAIETGWFPAGQSEEHRDRQFFAAVTGLHAFKPADEIEAMIAAQAMAAHNAAMECARRAMLREQPFEVAQGLRKAAANASRTFIELLAALDRRRKGGQQVVRVEHVHVHPGGQAIVGNVKAGETAATKPAAPLAIGQGTPGLTLDDLVGKQPGKQPEVGGRGRDRKPKAKPHA
jgi:hypothetical protein